MTAQLFPFRFQALADTTLAVTDAGDFAFVDADQLAALASNRPAPPLAADLLRKGFAYQAAQDFYWHAFQRRVLNRKAISDGIRYILAIPTLRCDLSCTYCQAACAKPFERDMDWTDQTEAAFSRFLQQTLDSLPPEETLVVEFQGGEPTLRSDVITRTLAQLDQSGARFRLVICTNLNRVSAETEALFAHPQVMISTSLDGPAAIHQPNRTKNDAATSRFFATLRRLIGLYGLSKISALPTITQADYGHLPQIIETYLQEGFSSIFLRPVSPHGFARKTSQGDDGSQWRGLYFQALEDLFQRNMTAAQPVREYGLEVALRRIFWPSFTGHVDLRSPNPAGRDSLVVDYDGRLYPSDESRMLARLKRIDLSMGHISSGIERTKAHHLSWNQMGETNEDCIHCAYQPFCGVDSIDDIARYDRTDLPRHRTRFCQDQMALFDFIFRKIEQSDPVALANFNGHLNGDFSETPFFAPPYLVEAP